MKETCRNLFILAGIGKPIGVDELFPANFLPGDIKSDYFKPMTLNSQIHSADSAAVTALVCGAEARIVEAMHEAGKYVIATPGFGAQVSRISKKTRGATSNKNRLLAAGFMAKERSDTVLTDTFCYAYNRLYLALQTNVAVKKAIENIRLDPATYEEALDMAERTYLETLSGYYRTAFESASQVSEALRISREKWLQMCVGRGQSGSPFTAEEYEVEIEYRTALQRTMIDMGTVVDSVADGVVGLNPSSATGLLDRLMSRVLGLAVPLKQRDLTDDCVLEGTNRLGHALAAQDSEERRAMLTTAHLKHLRPKRDFYLEQKLRDEGGRSIAATSVISNVFYESTFNEHFRRPHLFAFMLDTGRDGYIIPGSSSAAMVVGMDPENHTTMFTLGETLLGGVCGEIIETWRSLRGGSLTVVAGDSGYRFSSLRVPHEEEKKDDDGDGGQDKNKPAPSEPSKKDGSVDFDETADPVAEQYPYSGIMDPAASGDKKGGTSWKDEKQPERLGSTLYSVFSTDTTGSDTNIHAASFHIQNKLLKETYGLPICAPPEFKYEPADIEKLQKIDGLLDHILGGHLVAAGNLVFQNCGLLASGSSGHSQFTAHSTAALLFAADKRCMEAEGMHVSPVHPLRLGYILPQKSAKAMVRCIPEDMEVKCDGLGAPEFLGKKEGMESALNYKAAKVWAQVLVVSLCGHFTFCPFLSGFCAHGLLLWP